MPRHRGQERLCGSIAGFARECELQVVFDVIMAWENTGVARQFGELIGKGVEHVIHIAAVVHVARARVKQCVAREQRRLLGVRQQADVAHRVAGRVQALQLNGIADFDHVARFDATVHTRNLAGGLVVRNDFGACRGHHRCVAAGVVVVLVGIEDLCDLPALDFGGVQGFHGIQRVDGQRLTGLWASDEIVVIAE